CPYQGPLFPPPRNPLSTSAIQGAQESFAAQLEDALNGADELGSSLLLNETFFSISVFSSTSSLFTYHHVAAPSEVADEGLTSKTLDGDSIYRIGSVSKLLTLYTLLVAQGDVDWNQPITKFVPELSDGETDDELRSIQWEDVTIGALATHLAGISRMNAWGDQVFENSSTLEAAGLPSTYDENDIPTCGLGLLPNPPKQIQGLNKLGPFMPPFQTPVYSNDGYMVLAWALENMTGEPLTETFRREIVDPLKLSHTTFETPIDTSNAVVPGGLVDAASTSGWGVDLQDNNPAGSAYSTTNDVTAIGQSILQSSLLSKALTRRWLKPHARTSDDTQAVGAPWEIASMRIPLSDGKAENTSTTRVDLYTKGGDIIAYSSYLVLEPDRDFGFVVLGAGLPSAGNQIRYLSDLAARTWVSALEAAAREEATAAYAGDFASDDSAMSIVVEDGKPGLLVAEWVSHGVDVLAAAGAGASVRLYPTGLARGNKYAFRAITEALPASWLGGPIDTACVSWALGDRAQVASRMIDDFVIELDDEGRAVSVEPRAYRETLLR
ncbi:uncharacterized protein K452DRAFT_208381, partial [Aplosporella prunicola CBS 121167]